MKRLYRSSRNRVLAGVCGGIGEYVGIDPVIVRIIAVVLVFWGGSGLLAYVLAAIIIPLEPTSAASAEASAATPEAASVQAAPARPGQGLLFAGILLTVLGVMFLLRNLAFTFPGFYWFHRYVWHNFWPGLLIALGLFLILRKRD